MYRILVTDYGIAAGCFTLNEGLAPSPWFPLEHCYLPTLRKSCGVQTIY
jgi:hypothetical protein